ncbi:MAG TPA: isoprenylcysteine carboxylmethyltransferase family protein [Steroidobacteraceae bacterium]|jgi:protein-S-isoprenylcysteine O-methyltransferase|nr:isoprenylcysteine carboxylmethyltransferase family protein [Steroidobacteraceae bacterium]
MNFPISSILGIAYGLSEAGLAFVKRSRDDSFDADDSTLRVLWITILAAVTAGILAASRLPAAAMPAAETLFWLGCALFALGLTLRWYSIIYLGRFFTVNVAIHSSHEIIDTGPYRRIRHPSYTGALVAFLGLALSLANWVSLTVIVLPIFWAFSRRISTEETALANALGSPYINYMRRTKRLAPFIY